jgi:multidrug efflux pump subunit AcrA (membrane-fusion protein)
MSHLVHPAKRELLLALALLLGLAGCSGPKSPPAPSASDTPTVKLLKPELRTISRTVGQPGFIDAYEQTSLYAKVAGYVQQWRVDIGDRVQKDQLLLTLFVPELVEEYKEKLAQVELDQEQVRQAEKLVKVAEGNRKTATAQVAEAKATVGKYQAEVERWDSEVKRLSGLVKQKIVDQQVLDESVKQLKSNTASRDAAQANVTAAAAAETASEAALEKAQVDVDVAKAQVKVAQADARRLEALVGYTKITAPYDGVVVVRNVNTDDMVRPAQGDPSASPRSPDQSPTRAAPLYVVARTDVVRVYVDIPEMDANYVQKGTKAVVRVQALEDLELDASVTRTSWSLNVLSRTLRAEIDLPNPDAKLRPGMYAYGKVLIERPNVRALPLTAVIEIGNQTCCYLHEDGKAVRTPVQTGVSDGTWVEVLKKQRDGQWTAFAGDEQVILGDLSELADGQKVAVDR